MTEPTRTLPELLNAYVANLDKDAARMVRRFVLRVERAWDDVRTQAAIISGYASNLQSYANNPQRWGSINPWNDDPARTFETVLRNAQSVTDTLRFVSTAFGGSDDELLEKVIEAAKTGLNN